MTITTAKIPPDNAMASCLTCFALISLELLMTGYRGTTVKALPMEKINYFIVCFMYTDMYIS